MRLFCFCGGSRQGATAESCSDGNDVSLVHNPKAGDPGKRSSQVVKWIILSRSQNFVVNTKKKKIIKNIGLYFEKQD